MFTAKRTLIACFGLIGIAAANAAPAPTRLAPADIQKTFFNGQSFTSSTPSNIQFKMTFSDNGKVVREPVGKSGVKGEGTWTLDKDGFCTTWKNSKPNCFVVVATAIPQIRNNKLRALANDVLLALFVHRRYLRHSVLRNFSHCIHHRIISRQQLFLEFAKTQK